MNQCSKNYELTPVVLISNALKYGHFSNAASLLETLPPDETQIPQYNELANEFISNTNNTETNYQCAIDTLKYCAACGHSRSQIELGDYYVSGWPIVPDRLQAIFWFCLAAEKEQEQFLITMKLLHIDESEIKAAAAKHNYQLKKYKFRNIN